MVLVRAPRDLTESGIELSLGTTIGIKAKFKSPESHRSDFGGERKPISESDQNQRVQKWRLSIPLDLSRRDEAPAPNGVKIGLQTSPHAPPEVSAQRDYSGGTNERVPKATGRGQKKRPEKRSQEGGQENRRDKKNCPRNKAQDQSSKAATTAMMAVDESDRQRGVLYTYGRSMKVTGVRHVSLKCKIRSDEALKLVEEHSRVSKGNRKCYKRRKTEGLYRLEGRAQGDALRKVRKSGQTREGATSAGCPWRSSEERDRADDNHPKIVQLSISHCTNLGLVALGLVIVPKSHPDLPLPPRKRRTERDQAGKFFSFNSSQVIRAPGVCWDREKSGRGGGGGTMTFSTLSTSEPDMMEPGKVRQQQERLPQGKRQAAGLMNKNRGAGEPREVDGEPREGGEGWAGPRRLGKG
ncbi:hypothetical protein Acr_11g0004550 [Actinidia rufa]|uniref:Uncharacterized protein n=1 Tax=Actinidia rufa TaxID=165716 RepID=A0A7J0FD21_9ERIC|nr:hypothetical protein Acr_11g0004550 [Actinidia rufa]